MSEKLKKDKAILKLMIEIYCRGQKHEKKDAEDSLCPSCIRLYDYGVMRTDKCPYGHKKNFCSQCSIKCYSKEEREEIRKVMRYSGPRMIYRHPLLALKHALKM